MPASTKKIYVVLIAKEHLSAAARKGARAVVDLGKKGKAGLSRVEKYAKRARDQLQRMLPSMNAVKRAAKATVAGMLIVGAVLGFAFQRAIAQAANYERQLAQVSTMLDEASMKYLPRYKHEIQAMAIEFGEATETLAKGTYDILSASVAPEKAMRVLRTSARAAAAGLTDTGVAADAITTILNSYGMAAERAEEVSDILFGTVKRGKTTFAQLAQSIGMVAATSSQAGLSLEETGAMIATMTRAGLKTEMAVTSLSGILIAFLKPSAEGAKVARELGLEMNTTTLRTLGLAGVMDKLKDASAEQLAMLFPSIEGLRGFMAAINDTTGYTKDLNTMLNSTGLTQEAFAKQSATVAFKLSQVKEKIKAIIVLFGDKLMPSLKILLTHVDPLIDRLADWIENSEDINVLLEGMAKLTVKVAKGVTHIAHGITLIQLAGLKAEKFTLGWLLLSPKEKREHFEKVAMLETYREATLETIGALAGLEQVLKFPSGKEKTPKVPIIPVIPTEDLERSTETANVLMRALEKIETDRANEELKQLVETLTSLAPAQELVNERFKATPEILEQNLQVAARMRAEFDALRDKAVEVAIDVGSVTRSILSESFAVIGDFIADVVGGVEGAGKAMAASLLASIGEMAISIGRYMVLAGTGIEALKRLGGLQAIGLGLALIALGGILKGLSRRLATPSAGVGAGGVGAGGARAAAPARWMSGHGRGVPAEPRYYFIESGGKVREGGRLEAEDYLERNLQAPTRRTIQRMQRTDELALNRQ